MALSFAKSGDDDAVVSDINTTPLVDVMLVLLIIFLITIPVVTHTVPLKLPHETNHVRETKPENISISVDKSGRIYWSQERIANAEALTARLKTVSTKLPQPEVEIRGDSEAKYESIGRVIFACQRAGIVKIGFITEPAPRA
ncbi:MAG TPA: biopolymer transporter ExbD [Oxalicibacterium sp.]|jgi:biopolymer transport protein ExbD|nr:biopolymer transporter ExbD [Oxalicibacterium sp.]